MSLFTKKRRLSVEEFCRSFYDSSIFHRIVNSVDETEALWDEMRAQLTEVDPSLAQVDRMKFHHEMTALRLELVALAFDHSGFPDDKRIRLATATRAYLDANVHADILSSMGPYNDAVAESALDIATGERRRAARATFLNGYKRMMDLWPASQAFFYPNGAAPKRGDLVRMPTLAKTLRELAAAEKKARGNAVLIAETGSSSELNRGFLLRCGLLHAVVRATGF